jgi:hypothetical protein
MSDYKACKDQGAREHKNYKPGDRGERCRCAKLLCRHDTVDETGGQTPAADFAKQVGALARMRRSLLLVLLFVL